MGDALAEERAVLALAQVDRAEPFGHAPARHHRAGQLRGAADVVIRAGTGGADHLQLGRAPGEQDRQPHPQVVFWQRMMLFAFQHVRAAEAPPARDDRHLVERICPRQVEGRRGVPGLVHRQTMALLGLDRQRPHRAHHHLVARLLQVRCRDRRRLAPRGIDRRLVEQVLQIRAGKSRRAVGDRREFLRVGQRQVLRMDAEDRAPPRPVRQRQLDMPVEASGPEQRRVEHVRPVGRSQHHHRLAPAETVEFGQDLVQRLLALVMAAAEPRAAGPADAVEFVDEDHRRGDLARGFEHLAHPPGADADEDLDEFRAGGREERHVRLPGQRLGQERLAGARRPHQQHAVRHGRADLPEALGFAQELDQFGDLLLGLLLPRDILEGHPHRRLGRRREPPGEQPAEAAGHVAELPGHPARRPDIEAEDQEPRQQEGQEGPLRRRLRRHVDALRLEKRQQAGIGLGRGDRPVAGLRCRSFGRGEGQRMLGQHRRSGQAVLDHLLGCGVGHGFHRRLRRPGKGRRQDRRQEQPSRHLQPEPRRRIVSV